MRLFNFHKEIYLNLIFIAMVVRIIKRQNQNFYE
jgi:hypothetical protein